MEDYEDIEYEEDFYNTKESNRKKYKKRRQHDANLKKQVAEHGGWYRKYYLVEERPVNKFDFVPVPEPYIIKIYESSHCDRFRWAKKMARRAVRRNKDELFNGNLYKRLFDYFWEVY